MTDQKTIIIESALELSRRTGCARVFLFLETEQDCRWLRKTAYEERERIVLVIPRDLDVKDSEFRASCSAVIRSWTGGQSRFSRIKYAFLQGVLKGIIDTGSKLVCVLGPHGKSHLDTITIHDLALSWSEEFPFDVEPLIRNRAFSTIVAVVDVALDIGALGREGKSVGTIFVIGDSAAVMESSHQVVFNPFKGYPLRERLITRPEVVESIKELAKLDGAVIISDEGVVEAAGRHLETPSVKTKRLRGLGARHRAAAGITRTTEAVAVVVSESTGKVTIFEHGAVIATLEPLISRRMV